MRQGALGLARRRRAGGAGWWRLSGLPLLPVVRDVLFVPHGTARALVGLAWYLPMLAVEVCVFSVAPPGWRRVLDGPGWRRVAGGAEGT